MKQVYTTTLRLNLEKEADREAWEHLRRVDRKQYHSVNSAVIAAVNAYFSRKEQLEADPYLETREKEDAFLEKVMETLQEGLRQATVEDLEELRSEKALLLQKFEYAEDAGAEEFRKDIATMEAGLKKLETQEQKYSAELDKALTEYAELKAQATEFDPVELYEARRAIRPVQEKESEKQLEDAMHEKPFLIMLLGAKQETSRLLGEDAEERQVRQLIAHKRQEQHRNSISKRKRSDPER